MRLVGLFLLLAPCLVAVPLVPSSYDMRNGETGGFSYHDGSYDGSGDATVDGALLTGGSGELTDGVISPVNWINDINPWVGWVSFDPTITFRFDTTVFISAMSLHVDDADGLGAVSPPNSVIVTDGVGVFEFPVIDPAGSLPFWIDLNNLNLLGNYLDVTITRRVDLDGADECSPCQWVFMDEVTFFGEEVTDPVPEPSTWLLMAGGLTFLGWARRRRGY